MLRPPRYGWRVALVILLAGTVSALLAHVALQDFPYSGDEYSMFLQAEGFARGVLKAKAPPFADWVTIDHVVIDDFVRSKYPPGTAALLALGVKAGLPWLVTPLEAILALLFTWLAVRRVSDERRAFLTVAFLAAMPLFTYEAATFLSHTACLLFLSLALLAVVRWAERRRPLPLVGFGVCVGCLFLIRPIDAMLVGLSLGVFGSLSALLIAGASALPLVGASFWFNKLQYGSFLTDGYHAYMKQYVALYGADGATPNISLLHVVSPFEIFQHLTVLETFLLLWTVPGSALVAALGWVTLRREQRSGDQRTEPLHRMLGALLILFVALLPLVYVDVDDSPRPRYLSMLVIPLSFLAAAGWPTAVAFVRGQLGRTAAWLIGLAIWIGPVFLIASYLEHRVPEVWVMAGLSKEIARQHIEQGVVIVRAEWPARYARNGMFFDRKPLLLSVAASVSPDEVAARFPGQPVYEAVEPHGSSPFKHGWILRRVR